MLRNVVAILLLLAFTVQSFNKVLIVANYYANNAAFLKYCENKTVPQMNCNGQCVLMKKIQAEQHKEQKNPELKLENKNEVYFLAKTSFQYPEQATDHISYPGIVSIGYTADYSSHIFRPPVV